MARGGGTVAHAAVPYGRTDRDPPIANSMSKTIVALLLGVAAGTGHIRSVDDSAAAYVPALARRMFALIGAEGQYVFVDPAAKLVLAQTAVRVDGQNVVSARVETLALWGALVRQFGGT